MLDEYCQIAVVDEVMIGTVVVNSPKRNDEDKLYKGAPVKEDVWEVE